MLSKATNGSPCGTKSTSGKNIIFVGLVVSVALAIFVSPFASSSPDGLERVAEDKGFISVSENKEVLKSPLHDYSVSFIKNEKISTSVAGMFGTLLTFAAAFIVGGLIKSRKNIL
ncbi:MAG: PDGLE domain-containing protein [Elusimicrobiota bacterium]|nr:PDGLE domain-containing protein [Elusimicrobiota bacterium]